MVGKKETRVVNLRDEPYDIYIGRPSPFGNPFVVGEHGNREHCIKNYRTFFYNGLGDTPDYKKKVLALKGKRLGCYCKPLPCHGDIIVEYLEGHPNGK